MAVVVGRGSGAGRSLADRPGPRLLAAAGSALAATTLACAVVLVVRRTQVSFDTSGMASIAAVFGGVLLVAAVDVASTGARSRARTLQRLAVRLGLALALAAILPGPAALLAAPLHPLRSMVTAVAVALALFTLVAPGVPSLGRLPALPPLGKAGPRRHGRSADAPPAAGRQRTPEKIRPRAPRPLEIPDGAARSPPPPAGAPAPSPLDRSDADPAVIQQRFERYLLPDERMECLRGTLHLAVVAGSRLATGHVGFCPPFHQLPQVEVGTACEEVEATIVAAEILPWGARVECRLDEPADETILIPIDVLARAPLPVIEVPSPSPLR